MIIIKNKDPWWIVNLIKDLNALGIENYYDGIEVKFELCNKKISLHNHYKNDVRNSFPNVNYNFITVGKDFVTIDIEGLKEHFEKLLEKNKDRKQAKNLISFDSEMFAMLFDGKVDETSGLTVITKDLRFAKGKCASIELNYFEEKIYLYYSSSKKYVDLKDVDLFEVPWTISGIACSIFLKEFFEKFEEESIKKLSEEIIKIDYDKENVRTELNFLERTPKTKRDEQCKKDISWRKSELDSLENQKKNKIKEIFKSIGLRYNDYEEEEDL